MMGKQSCTYMSSRKHKKLNPKGANRGTHLGMFHIN